MTVPPPPGSVPPPPTPPVPPPPGMPPIPQSGGQSQTNGLAVTAMILGIVSICFSVFTGIPAIIFGVLGKKKAAETGVGSGQALTGIILGIIGIVIGIVWLVFVVFIGTTADKVSNDFEKSIKESTKSYEDQQDRNGEVADSLDFMITDEEVDVSSYGSITYSAFLENTADFESGFTVTVECEGDLGDLESEDVSVYDLKPGNKKKIQSYFSFDTDTTSATCQVTEVLYGY